MSSDLREAIEKLRRENPSLSDEESDARFREIQQHLELEQRASREAAWEGLGIPRRLFMLLRSSVTGVPEGGAMFRPTKALEAVGRFLSPSDEKTFLVLAGGEGNGKTTAAAWAAAFHGGRVAKAIDVIRAGMFPDDPSFLPSLWRARVLVLDDLGAEPLDGKDYGLASVVDLVDRRYDAARKTIVTTNSTLEEFRSRYGTGPGLRLWVRFREAGRFLEIAEPSMRGPGQ